MPKKKENSSTSVKTVGCFFERLDQPFWGKCRRPKDEGQKEGQKRNHLRRRPKAAWLIHGVDSLGYTNKGHWSWSLNFPSTFSGNRSSLCCYLHEFPAWFAPSNIYIWINCIFIQQIHFCCHKNWYLRSRFCALQLVFLMLIQLSWWNRGSWFGSSTILNK